MPTASLRAGWGDYAGPPPRIALNNSRITAFLDCERKSHIRYIQNLWPEERSSALKIGSLWHRALELIDSDDADTVAARIASEANAQALTADADGAPKLAKDLRKFAEWVILVLPRYVTHYADDPIRVLGRERAFWLLIDEEILIRGRFDAIGNRLGQPCNLEAKTMGKDTDPVSDSTIKRNSLQAIIYYAALSTITGEQATTVYDSVRKAPYPVKASSNGTVEERRTVWERSLFYRETFAHGNDDIDHAVTVIREVANRWGSNLRNQRACATFGRVDCPVFDYCYNGDDSNLLERQPDYVDESETTR